MPDQLDDRGDERPEEPARPARGAEPREAGDQEGRHEPHAAPASDGVEHVPAVELTHGEEVERGHEEPEPAGGDERVEGDAVRLDAQHEPHEPRREHRVAEEDAAARHGRQHLRAREPGDRDRHGDDRPGPRAGRADVEESAAVREGRADADEGAEGAGKRRAGQEVGQGRVDAMPTAHEIVPGLVGEEDREQRHRVRDAGDQRRRLRERIAAGLERTGERRGCGRHEHQDRVQQGTVPDDAHAAAWSGHVPGARAEVLDLAHGTSIRTSASRPSPRVASAEPSRTASSRRPQLPTMPSGVPRATAP
jgi:hypothetical protein